MPLREVDPRLAGGALRRLEQTRSADAALGVLTGWLAHASQPATAVPGGLRYALRMLRQAHGNLRIGDLVRGSGCSERQLRRACHAVIGIGPKALARQLRFLAAVEAADRAERPDWADLAVRFGYYDQAHLIAESQCLAGATPTTIHAERRAQR